MTTLLTSSRWFRTKGAVRRNARPERSVGGKKEGGWARSRTRPRKNGRWNKKAIISTILIMQLVLLVLVTFSVLRFEKTSFSNEVLVTRIAAFKLASNHNSIIQDLDYLRSKEADNETLDGYTSFVDSTFSTFFATEITINQTHLAIRDHSLQMQKVTP